MKHLLSTREMSRAEALQILDTAEAEAGRLARTLASASLHRADLADADGARALVSAAAAACAG